MCARDHFVQFYDEDQTIIESVAGYFAFGLRFGEGCVLVGMRSHNADIVSNMRSIGCDVDAALADGQLIVLDAEELLPKFMVAGMPDKDAFDNVVGKVISDATRSSKPPRVFGEMVGVLTERGEAEAAIALERSWNQLAKRMEFRLFCAYSNEALRHAQTAGVANDICASHSQVIGWCAP